VIIRTVKIKLFQPGNKKAITQRCVAGPRRHFTAANIEKILAEFVEKVEAAMPDRYRMVQVGRGEFNFVRVDTELEQTAAMARKTVLAKLVDQLGVPLSAGEIGKLAEIPA
jgi:hypothetical protein